VTAVLAIVTIVAKVAVAALEDTAVAVQAV
jgi:hypothetical protein